MKNDITVVKFKNGYFGVRKGNPEEGFQFLDIGDALTGMEEMGGPFINWRDDVKPGEEEFYFCVTDERELALQAYDFVMSGGGVSDDYGEPIVREEKPIPFVSFDGVRRIATERIRQVQKEKFLPGWDDQYENEELATAAACYAAPKRIAVMSPTSIDGCWEDAWPWREELDKRDKHSRIRQLEIAGALIAAEIDRLLRGGLNHEN